MIMKNLFYFLILAFLVSCEPEWVDPYETFVIEKGSHGNFGRIQSLVSDETHFRAIFNETAIYTSGTAENQHDANKLLGFSDCNSHHHQHSARFGWRWLNDQLEIVAYCYNSGKRIIEYVGAVELNEMNDYYITLTENSYEFRLNNGPVVSIPRIKPCDRGFYYMLWPYFGGDEVAPHNIEIKVQLMF